MYQRVLLAYDGSREGALALREGALLARRFRAEVFLLSVVAQTAELLIADGVQGGVMARQRKDYEDLMSQAVKRLRQLGFDPKVRLVQGEPAPAIAAVAKEVGADLVVVGHRPGNFLARWWTGAQKDYLCDRLSCSLLIARKAISDEEFEAEIEKFRLLEMG